jgi:hypothetical protein
MHVSTSYFNSIDLRPASQPYSTEYGEYEYVRKHLMDDVLRVQLVVSGMDFHSSDVGIFSPPIGTFSLLDGVGVCIRRIFPTCLTWANFL